MCIQYACRLTMSVSAFQLYLSVTSWGPFPFPILFPSVWQGHGIPRPFFNRPPSRKTTQHGCGVACVAYSHTPHLLGGGVCNLPTYLV